MQTTRIMELTSETFDRVTADGLTLVDFWAPWCRPCQMQGAVLEDLARSAGDDVRIAKVNVDNEGHLAGRFRVSAIPLIVLVKDGQEVARLVGYQDKGDITQLITRFGEVSS